MLISKNQYICNLIDRIKIRFFVICIYYSHRNIRRGAPIKKKKSWPIGEGTRFQFLFCINDFRLPGHVYLPNRPTLLTDYYMLKP